MNETVVDDCRKHCGKYVSRACRKFDVAPYVCNTCLEKKLYVLNLQTCSFVSTGLMQILNIR